MTVDIAGAVSIWSELLLPTHWPVLAAGWGVSLYWRRLKRRGLFFVVAWGMGYGIQGLVSTPWPIIWMVFFDQDSGATLSSGAARSLGLMVLASAVLTLWGIRTLATRHWHRLFP